MLQDPVALSCEEEVFPAICSSCYIVVGVVFVHCLSFVVVLAVLAIFGSLPLRVLLVVLGWLLHLYCCCVCD